MGWQNGMENTLFYYSKILHNDSPVVIIFLWLKLLTIHIYIIYFIENFQASGESVRGAAFSYTPYITYIIYYCSILLTSGRRLEESSPNLD